ncbi:MAG: type ISP restriction/modification enzyme, partial [bacterium]
KIDFPRIPFTKDYMLFKTMSEYGNKLVDLHLLKSSKLDQPVARFQGKGDNRVEKLRYDSKAELLYINDTQYFEGIKPEVFEYQIGGYQVCDKWLKDRKDRTLSLEEIQTYCRIATAIENTIKIQDRIDAVYQQTEKDTVRI